MMAGIDRGIEVEVEVVVEVEISARGYLLTYQRSRAVLGRVEPC